MKNKKIDEHKINEYKIYLLSWINCTLNYIKIYNPDNINLVSDIIKLENDIKLSEGIIENDHVNKLKKFITLAEEGQNIKIKNEL